MQLVTGREDAIRQHLQLAHEAISVGEAHYALQHVIQVSS